MVKPRYLRCFHLVLVTFDPPQPPSCCLLAQSIPDPNLATIPTATVRLLEILETTTSPLARVDDATGNSFINNIEKTDDEETILEKVGIWYRDIVGVVV